MLFYAFLVSLVYAIYKSLYARYAPAPPKGEKKFVVRVLGQELQASILAKTSVSSRALLGSVTLP